MVGGPRSSISQKIKVKQGGMNISGLAGESSETINMDISGPGATLALGLMFFDSGKFGNKLFFFSLAC